MLRKYWIHRFAWLLVFSFVSFPNIGWSTNNTNPKNKSTHISDSLKKTGATIKVKTKQIYNSLRGGLPSTSKVEQNKDNSTKIIHELVSANGPTKIEAHHDHDSRTATQKVFKKVGQNEWKLIESGAIGYSEETKKLKNTVKQAHP